MINYYNENDPKAAAWLRELIKEGHIANGVVDERSIKDVQPNDLTEFTQCHFFAGIGGWSYALRLAGWPDDRPVWTGSCPCQPFSDAGQKGGTKDKRHLWPDFFRLIRERRPTVVFGEQVASKDGLAWLDIVSADLESADYAVGAADLCAAGVGAPHIRQRLYFVADNIGERRFGRPRSEGPAPQDAGQRSEGVRDVEPRRVDGGLDHVKSDGRREERADAGGQSEGDSAQRRTARPQPSGMLGELADSSSARLAGRALEPARQELAPAERSGNAGELGNAGTIFSGRNGAGFHQPEAESNSSRGPDGRFAHGPWSASEWLECIDGKWRPVEPGTCPLAHGIPARMGRLRGYGNAIVPQVAAEFVRAAMDSGHGC